GLRVDRDRGDPELAAGADHAHRDLAAVGDEQLREAARAQSGMFPCLRGGLRSRLLRAISSPATIFLRVLRGSITSSTKPRSAATYGFANFSRNSRAFSRSSSSGSLAACSSRR